MVRIEVYSDTVAHYTVSLMSISWLKFTQNGNICVSRVLALVHEIFQGRADPRWHLTVQSR